MINLTTAILGEDNEQAVSIGYDRDEDGKQVKKEVKADLYKLVRECLLSQNGDRDQEKIEARYDLFRKVQDKDEVELSQEERDLILELAPDRFDVLFVGQMIKLLK